MTGLCLAPDPRAPDRRCERWDLAVAHRWDGQHSADGRTWPYVEPGDLRPRLLDLFAGAQGAAVGYARAGFAVHAVDVEDHDRHPEVASFMTADAFDVLADVDFCRSFDVITGSPPCQPFTAYRRRGAGVGSKHRDLVAELRAALVAAGRPYVIENVPGAPLHAPLQLCGSSFGLDIRRHRLFESNAPLMAMPCNHAWQQPRFAPATNRTNPRWTVEVGVWRIPLDVQQHAMGIDWMSLADLTEAVPPAYTQFLGEQLIDWLSRRPALDLTDAATGAAPARTEAR